MSNQVKANVRVHGSVDQAKLHSAAQKFIKKSKGGKTK